MESLTAPTMWPLSPIKQLKQDYLRRTLQEIEAPAAILDLAVLRRNCDLMLHTSDVLKVGFRAHVKTHKVSISYRLPSTLFSF